MGYIGSGPTRFNTADELTVTGNAEFNGNLTVKGTTTTIDSASVQTVDLGDNDKIRLGDGDDLQIYHDGSHSRIAEVGNGRLTIETNGDSIRLTKGATENMLIATPDGSVDLYYDNASKLATTATGVDVTGTVTADGLTVDGNIEASYAGDSTTAVRTSHDGTTGLIASANFGTGYTDLDIEGKDVFIKRGIFGSLDAIKVEGSTGDISFYDDTGVTQGFFWDASTQRLGLGTTSPQAKAEISGGLDNRLRINSTDGTTSNNYGIDFSTAGTVRAGIRYNAGNNYLAFYGYDNTERMRIDPSGNVGIGVSSVLNPSNRTALQVSGGSQGGGIFFGTSTTDTENSRVVSDASGGVYIATATTGGAPIAFYTGNAERIRIDSSGNVGIGTSSPSSKVEISGTGFQTLAVTSTNSSPVLKLNSAASSVAYLQWNNAGSSPLSFYDVTASAERMRISSSGNLLVGTTNETGDGQGLELRGDFENGGYVQIKKSSSSVSGNKFINFARDGSVIGSVSMSGTTAVAYNTSSDYRLKTAVNYDWDATTRLKQLRPARFEWIADGDDAVPVDGFLAHEVQDIVPEAITGTKDAMRDEEYQVSAATGDIYTPAIEAVLDEDGNEVTPAVAEVIHSTDVERPEELAEGQLWRETTPAVMGTRSVPDYQGIDQSKLVPLLVKTIQELEARITALETA